MSEGLNLSTTNMLGDAASINSEPLRGAEGVTDGNGAETVTPMKRKPGRPKGSGKKPTGPASDPIPKIKRPVGRPRKDGLPAGSAGSRRSARPRKIEAPNFGPAPNGTSPGGFLAPTTRPPWAAGFSLNESVPPMATSFARRPPSPQFSYPIDPNLDGGNWVEIARTKPILFLQTLLVSLAAPNPVSSVGPSVEEAFKSHLVSLSPTTQVKGNQAIPSLYSILKTFWLPSSPAYFSLTASASTARTPSEHRFLYWDPQPLVFNGIACPSCSSPLTNSGTISSGPIKVYDLEKPFFIIGCEYVCKSSLCVSNTSSEGRKFASTDASILRSLPTKLTDEFPAYLMPGDSDAGSGANIWNWQAMGVSRSLWNMVRGSLRVGLGKDSILHVIRVIQYGVPDEPEPREVEEDADEDEEEPQPPNQASGATIASDPSQKDTFTDAFQNAWKANSAGNTNAEAGPSTLAAVATAVNPNAGDGAVNFGFPTGAQYVPYSQAPFAFFQLPPNQAPGQANPSVHNSLKRPFSFAIDEGGDGGGSGGGAADSSSLEAVAKRIRHCCKCGSQECKGKGGRTFCTNACQDCGRLDCKGRNSRRPDKKCADAWS